MRKIIILSILILTNTSCFAQGIYDANWCRENGGKIEFDKEFNISFNCITNDIYDTNYLKKLYNILFIPYYSSIVNNETPRFLKVISLHQKIEDTILDEYNFKLTENELVRYI